MNQENRLEILKSQKESISLIFSIYESNHKIYQEMIKNIKEINETNKRNFNSLFLLNLIVLLLFFWFSRII